MNDQSNHSSMSHSQVISSNSNPLPKDLKDPNGSTLIELAHFGNYRKIKEFLDLNPSLAITTLRDTRLYTVLHIACLNNQYEICNLFLNYANDQKLAGSILKEWINAKTDEGFVAIHFASFKGNIDLIDLLEQNGANVFEKNNKGLNVIHIAAQGDQSVSIAYFLEKGLKLTDKDNNGNTALHWAAYYGMENSTYCLASWGSNLDDQETLFGCTPLHLAVNSGNIKVVRKLLLKGANPKIMNYEEKLPIDLAHETESEAIAEILKGRNLFVECLNIKPPLGKQKSRSPLYFTVLLYVVLITLNVLFLFPYIQTYGWMIFQLSIMGIAGLTFILTWLSNPGTVNNKKNGDSLKLLLTNEPHNVCPECIIVKPERSRHCEYCNTCVCVYDHHCPWVNNCIGAKNYKYFITFISTAFASIVSIAVLAIFHIETSVPAYRYSGLYMPNDETLADIKFIVCVADLALVALFGLPLFGLNVMHFTNLVKGKTTNERFSYKPNGENHTNNSHEKSSLSMDLKSTGLSDSRNGTGCISNCYTMCCGNASNMRYFLMEEKMERSHSHHIEIESKF